MTEEVDAVVQSKMEIDNFLKSIEAQNFVQAERQFGDLLGQRISDALDQSKAKIASQVFGDDDEELDDEDVSDDEIENALDEMEDDEEEDEDEDEEEDDDED